jgi:hypothetical protein
MSHCSKPRQIDSPKLTSEMGSVEFDRRVHLEIPLIKKFGEATTLQMPIASSYL